MDFSNMNQNGNEMMSITSLFNSPIFIVDHSHPLIYCFTTSRANCGNSWICNKCNSSFTYDIPTFYCIFCDYDLCKQCLEKYTIGNVFVFNYNTNNFNNISNPINKLNWQISLPMHSHYMTLIKKVNTNQNWICKFCSNSYNNNESFYYCSLCDYKLCQYCSNKFPNAVKGIIGQDQIPQSIKVIFELMGIKKEMTFKYGTTVAEALTQYAINTSNIITSLVFIYNNSLIFNSNNMKVEDFFKKNEYNYIIVIVNTTEMMNQMMKQMMNPVMMG